jgi:hypothetical protein
MRSIGLIGMGVLFLLFETVAPMQARQEQHQQEQQAKPGGQQAKGQQEQQHKQQQQQAKGQQEQQHKQQQQQQANRPSQQEQHGQRGQQQVVWQEHRAHSWQSEHRDWQQRGGYRIPEDRYRSYFGPSHAFRIYRYPVVVVGGFPRFQYGGFSFSLVDPWPEYWSDDWYDNDDVYVDYTGDGYYLYNRRYPQDRIAIVVYVQ